jgi:hypothetical protein
MSLRGSGRDRREAEGEMSKLTEQLGTVGIHEEAKSKVHGLLFNIGAPLNDNLLQFSREQMAVLFRIAEVLGIR